MRLRLTFAKTEAMCYTSHLDLSRTLERTLRRARLPLSYSKGYTRRPKINFASPLPLGFTGEREMADVWLEEPKPLGEVRAAIIEAAPPGMQLQSVEEVDPSLPKLQNVLRAAEYIAVLLEPFPELNSTLEKLLVAKTLPRERRGKPYDLRPLIIALYRQKDDEGGHQRLRMTLKAQEGATGRADEVIDALGIDPHTVRFHRMRLNFDP